MAKNRIMTFFQIALFGLLTVFTSCNGQNTIQLSNPILIEPNSTGTVGDTVTALGNNLMNIFQDKNNNYWFGSNGEGVYRFDGKTIIHYTTEDGLCHNQIGKIQEDKSGNIYFNSNIGISKFDGQTFTTLSITRNAKNEWKLDPDDLWFSGAQDSGVVYRYDGTSLFRLEFPKTKAGEAHISSFPRSKFPHAKYSPYDVYITYKDTKGNVWFGTSTLGVCRYNGMSFMWISENDLEFDVSTAFGIRSIIEDKDDNFWISNSLHRYQVYGQDSVINYGKEKGIGSLDGKKDGDVVAIMSMVKDNNGDLWMVTHNAGVWSYDGKNITHYPVGKGDKAITLFSIYKDNQGDLWLGTHEEGAYKFNGTTFEKFKP